jgi:DNA-binding beta-propeller fold protein YncE
MTVVADLKRAHRALMTCMVVAGAWLALAGGASAAPGQLAYDGCLSNDDSQGCVDLPSSPLTNPGEVAVSPDGKSVYVTSFGTGSIGHFFRGGPKGQLAWDGCLSNTGTQGCGDLPGAPIAEADGVAASPDGKSVYVISEVGDSIARFSRTGPDGQLSYDGCLNNDGSQGCGDLPSAPLDGPTAVAVSPDGRSVYVTSFFTNSVSHFFRGPEGELAWDGCLSNTGTQNCGDLPGAPIEAPYGVAVSPDSKSVYVVGYNDGSIAHFFSDGPEGQIAWDGCLNNDGSKGCGDLPFAPMLGATGVAVSPDGKSVYVASFVSDSIAHLFAAGPRGQIAWDGCLNNDGSQGCGDLPGAPLDGARGVATSGDGKSVYVASQFSESIAHLFRNGPEGQITYDGCLATDTSHGCGDLPFAPIAGASGVAVSPDGKSVYVASAFSNSVAHFMRETAPAEPPDTPDLPGTPGTPGTPDPNGPNGPSADTVAPSISKVGLTNRRFRVGRRATALVARRAAVGTVVRYTLSESAAVTLRIQRAVAGRRVGRSCRLAGGGRPCRRWVTAGTLRRSGLPGPNRVRFSGRIGGRALRPGAYRLIVTATDAAGNRASGRSQAFRVVR